MAVQTSITFRRTFSTPAPPRSWRARWLPFPPSRLPTLPPDPIYAPIERHRQAHEAQGTTCDRTDDVTMAAIAAGVR